jgi:hypothetical protein
MIAITPFILIFLSTLITPTLTAPVKFPANDTLILHTSSSDTNIKEHSSISPEHPHRKDHTATPQDGPSVQVRLVAGDQTSSLDSRSVAGGELESRSFDDLGEAPLARRDEHERMKLMRRKAAPPKASSGNFLVLRKLLTYCCRKPALLPRSLLRNVPRSLLRKAPHTPLRKLLRSPLRELLRSPLRKLSRSPLRQLPRSLLRRLLLQDR